MSAITRAKESMMSQCSRSQKPVVLDYLYCYIVHYDTIVIYITHLGMILNTRLPFILYLP